MQILVLIKQFAAAFFVRILWRPVRAVLRFVFYAVIVKVYKNYLFFLKKLGLNRLRRRYFFPRSLLANRKLAHVFLLAISLILLANNLTAKAKAQSSTNAAKGTMVAAVVQNEFSETELELIEEFNDPALALNTGKKYAADDGFLRPEAVGGNDQAEEEESVALIEEGSAIVKPGMVSTTKTKQERSGVVTHTVQAGETVSMIAQEYEVSVNTILWENNLTAFSIIKPGDQLSILPKSGVSYKVAKGDNLKKIASKFDIDEAAILAANNIADASLLKIDQTLFIPGGSKLAAPSQSAAVARTYSGISAITSLVKSPSAKPVKGNLMNWPTVGHRITQYYSWKHAGLDVANKVGTAIYAADAGTIEFAGWNNGYGNNIIVNHGGGKKTRYAHLSKFYVKKGESVSKGEAIAAMGNTGWSTGPHLHFEVIINGVKYNPLNYVK